MVYSAWGKNGVADTFIRGDRLANELRRIEPDLELVKLFDASSWNDAMRQWYEWQGWGPYKPMLDADGNEYPEDSLPDAEAPAESNS